MYTDAENLVHEIFSRYLRSLGDVMGSSANVPTGTVCLILNLALQELAERLPALVAVAALADSTPNMQPIAMASAAPAATVTVDSDSEPQPKKRMGRPPKAKAKPEPEHRSAEPEPVISPYNIAVAAPAAIGLDPDLVTDEDDEPITMTGILRRQETVTRHVNGVPTAVTRQYIELR